MNRMYLPQRSGTKKRKTLRGGDYISSLSTIGVPADISPSSLMNILSVARLSSTTEFSRLSVEQITNLIAGIDTQISANSAQISRLTSEIATVENSITRLPDGLEAQFNTADVVFLSTEREYIRVSTMYETNIAELSTTRSELSTLILTSGDLYSSLQGYQTNYSSILSTYRNNKQMLDAETAAYNRLLGEYYTQSTTYSVAYGNYQSTLSSISGYGDTLSTLSSTYTVTQGQYASALADYVNYSTVAIPQAQSISQSTLSSYNSLVLNRDTILSTVYGASTASRYAEFQLQVATATQQVTDLLAAETALSNQLVALTNEQAQTTDPVRSMALSTIIPSTQTQYTATRTSTVLAQSTVSSLISTTFMNMVRIAEQTISTTFLRWQDAKQQEGSLLSTITGLSSSVLQSFPQEGAFISTLSSLSTTYRSQTAVRDGFSAELFGLTSTQTQLSTFLRSTLVNIDTYIKMSTLWGLSTITFQNNYTYWSTVETESQSTLDGYISQKNTLVNQISSLNTDIRGINTSLATEFSKLDVDATTFYSKKRIELLAEVDEFRFAAREYNSYIGALTAELLIQRLNLFDQVDLLTFQIQSTIVANDQATKAALESTRTVILGDQNVIQTIVNTLNPLEVSFNTVDLHFQDERTYKESFIQLRSTLHVAERNALSSPTMSTSLRTEYMATWATLEGVITTINTRINARNSGLDAISTTLGMERASRLNIVMAKYPNAFTPFPPVANYPYGRATMPIQTRLFAMNDVYALMAPIPFV